MDMDIDFLLRLKKLKRVLDKSYKEMSNDLNLSISYISEIFLGKKKPNFDFFKMLIEKYQVNIDWIFNGNGEMFTEKNLNPSSIEKFNTEMDILKDLLSLILNDKALFNELLFRLKYQQK